MEEDIEAFMNRLVRDRAVVRAASRSSGLSPQERRSWWEFYLGMSEFLGRLIQHDMVSRDAAHQLARLQWICIQGTYVFATRDPALWAEQSRYVDLCGCLAAAFAVIVDDPEGIWDLSSLVFGMARSKQPALNEALVENQLRGWKDWRDADSPIGWVRERSSNIHEHDHTQGGNVRERDALYRTPESKRAADAVSLAFDYRGASRKVMRLEEIADLPGVAEISLTPRYTWMSVARLEADIRDDKDLRAYVQLRSKGWKRRAAWERLGWEANFGEAVDRRYRRLLAKIKGSGFEYEVRNIETDCGLSDASCTVVKERLRFPVNPASEATLSGRVVYAPRVARGESFERSD